MRGRDSRLVTETRRRMLQEEKLSQGLGQKKEQINLEMNESSKKRSAKTRPRPAAPELVLREGAEASW